MRKHFNWFFVAALVVAGLALPAWAQDDPPSGGPGAQGTPPQAGERLGPRDQGGPPAQAGERPGGRPSQDRPAAGRPGELSDEQIDRLFKALDEDGNGQIDRQELTKRLPAVMGRLEKRAGMGPRGDREPGREGPKDRAPMAGGPAAPGAPAGPPCDQGRADAKPGKADRGGPQAGCKCPYCGRAAAGMSKSDRDDRPGRGRDFAWRSGERDGRRGGGFAERMPAGPGDGGPAEFGPRHWGGRFDDGPAFQMPGRGRGWDRWQGRDFDRRGPMFEPRGFGGFRDRDDDAPPCGGCPMMRRGDDEGGREAFGGPGRRNRGDQPGCGRGFAGRWDEKGGPRDGGFADRMPAGPRGEGPAAGMGPRKMDDREGKPAFQTPGGGRGWGRPQDGGFDRGGPMSGQRGFRGFRDRDNDAPPCGGCGGCPMMRRGNDDGGRQGFRGAPDGRPGRGDDRSAKPSPRFDQDDRDRW